MSHPCKKCLVRAACSKECKEWKSYSSAAAHILTFVSIMLSAATVLPIIIWLTHIADTTKEEWPHMVITGIWIFSFIIVTIIQAPYDEDMQISFFPRMFLAPVVLGWMIVIHSAKKYFRRP